MMFSLRREPDTECEPGRKPGFISLEQRRLEEQVDKLSAYVREAAGNESVLIPVSTLTQLSKQMETLKKSVERVICPWCKAQGTLIWVVSHVQCTNCKQVVETCCEGS